MSAGVPPYGRILGDIFGPGYSDESQSMEVYVSRLRRKIEDGPAHSVDLLTEHGLGHTSGG
jgi:two-component system KDP operon response regulator KdpE